MTTVIEHFVEIPGHESQTFTCFCDDGKAKCIGNTDGVEVILLYPKIKSPDIYKRRAYIAQYRGLDISDDITFGDIMLAFGNSDSETKLMLPKRPKFEQGINSQILQNW